MSRIKHVVFLIGILVSVGSSASAERQDHVALLRTAVAQLCPLTSLSGWDAQLAITGSWVLEERQLPSPDNPRLITVRLALSNGDELTLERRQINGVLRQFRAAHFVNDGGGAVPSMLAIADGNCHLQSGREIRRADEVSIFLDQLEGDLKTLRWTETLQMPWPEGTDRGGVRVGLIDSGLAYDLPEFRDRLARDEAGVPLGFDFWDEDPWPYDGDVSRGAFLPIRHGTAVASILAREAPSADLVPFRYPRPDMKRMRALLDRAAQAGVRILAVPLGSNNRDDWTAFADALERHDMLAVVSAGNDGRDIDAEPVFPAALPLERIIVVTSADEFGRLAPGSNWGATHVDVMLPAENLDVVDFRGAQGTASGSSYAVPRLAAIAARILETDKTMSAVELKQRLLARAAPSPFERSGVLAVGWIPNPLDD